MAEVLYLRTERQQLKKGIKLVNSVNHKTYKDRIYILGKISFNNF